MTALSANQVVRYENQRTRQKAGVTAGAIHIYKGALLCWAADGYLTPATDTANLKFAGVALEELNQAAGGSDGDNLVEFIPAGSGAIVTMTTGTIAVTNIGDKVYVKDDGTVDLAAATTNDIEVGTIRRVISTKSAEVQI